MGILWLLYGIGLVCFWGYVFRKQNAKHLVIATTVATIATYYGTKLALWLLWGTLAGLWVVFKVLLVVVVIAIAMFIITKVCKAALAD